MPPHVLPGPDWMNSLWVWLSLPLLVIIVWSVTRTNLIGRLHRTLTRSGRFLGDLVMPFRVIATEMRRMNDLKELELAERLNPKTGDREPIIPVTEEPGSSDTEVFWGVEPKAHGIAAMRRQWQREAEVKAAEDEDDDTP